MSAPEQAWPEMIFAWQNYRRFWAGPWGTRAANSKAYLRADGLPREMAEALREYHAAVTAVHECSPETPLPAIMIIHNRLGQLQVKTAALLAKWDTLMEKGDG